MERFEAVEAVGVVGFEAVRWDRRLEHWDQEAVNWAKKDCSQQEAE